MVCASTLSTDQRRSQYGEYSSYVQDISFRFISPDCPIPAHSFVALLTQLAGSVGLSLEYANTVLPGDVRDKRRLRPLLRVPRASTLAIGAMIQRAVAQMPADQCYVNIGVWNGFTLFAGMRGNPDQRCVGVDNYCFGSKYAHKRGLTRIRQHYPRRLSVDWARRGFATRFGRIRSPRHEFHDMDFVNYFRDTHRGDIGVYMYDGMHRYDDQFRGLELAEPYLAPGCIVFVDDINGEGARNGTYDFIHQSDHRYDVLLDRTTRCNHHPTLWNGIAVFRKRD